MTVRPAAGRLDLLRGQLADAYGMLRERLEGLTDDEFWWEPVPGCWTVRRTERGTWTADYAVPDPTPPPFTTIGWRLVHVGECKRMYHEYAFGAATLVWPDIDSAHTADDAIRSLDAGQALIAADLDGLHDEALDHEVRTNWGERWPASRIFWTLIRHDLHHGGEIGALRDLYRARNG